MVANGHSGVVEEAVPVLRVEEDLACTMEMLPRATRAMVEGCEH
jgi:hypothetical protein